MPQKSKFFIHFDIFYISRNIWLLELLFCEEFYEFKKVNKFKIKNKWYNVDIEGF